MTKHKCKCDYWKDGNCTLSLTIGLPILTTEPKGNNAKDGKVLCIMRKSK